MLREIFFLALMTKFLFAKSDRSDNGVSEKQDVILRESFGDKQSSVLLLTIIDLVKEVKDLHYLVKAHSEKMDHLDELIKKMGDKTDNMEAKLVDTIDLIKNIEDQNDDMESKLVNTIWEVESRLVQNIKEMESKVTNVDSKIEVWRSEVRLISQQKLTWQNTTQKYHYSDFAVDGVYTLSKDMEGVNPMQHIDGSQINHMLIIDLGGFFKIHSVKIWNRIGCCQDRLGVMIYADEELLGGIYEPKRQYNFKAKDKVYARKIYLKQTRPLNMNYVEVQVFGTGPYDECEVKELQN